MTLCFLTFSENVDLGVYSVKVDGLREGITIKANTYFDFTFDIRQRKVSLESCLHVIVSRTFEWPPFILDSQLNKHRTVGFIICFEILSFLSWITVL